MDQEQERYDKIIKVLRRSRPAPGDPEHLSEKVISRIQKERTSVSVTELISEFIFGWVYIGWMRRSMVTAAICFMLFFGYQQAVMMKRIDALSSSPVVDVNILKTGTISDLTGRIKMYTRFGKRAGESNVEISEKDLDKFIESVNALQVQYKDIFRLIETDPELKKHVEDRLNKNRSLKPKI
jgi:hypothetical protein